MSNIDHRGGPTDRSRRDFIRSAAGLSFVVPLLRNGKLGQPMLAPQPYFLDAATPSGLAAFRDVCGSPAKDYLIETTGSGVAVFDYNNDGLMDIFFVNGSSFQILADSSLPRTSSRLFRNNGDGTFTDVTQASGLVNHGWGMGVAVADFDNDGYADVFITNFGTNALFHNNGNGTFTNVTREAGVQGGNWSSGCAWGDYDGDGRLDLYVARYIDFDRAKIPQPGTSDFCRYQGLPVACGPRGLPALPDLFYHNEGGGRFREVSCEIGMCQTDPRWGWSAVWSDFDNDGRLDIFVANDSAPNFLWHNNGDGTFTEMGLETGCALSGDGRAQACMGVAVGDYDNDGWIDLLTTTFSEDYDTLYHNHKGVFQDVSLEAGLGEATFKPLGWGASFVDFDNDGWRDLFIANGHIYPQVNQGANSYDEANLLFRNQRNGTFRALSSEESGFIESRSSRGSAFGVFNNSGRQAIVVNNIDDTPFYYRPVGQQAAGWVRFKLIGTKCNRDAIGARIKVIANGITQLAEVRSGESYISTADIRPHFGLGTAKTIERVEIRWPGGATDEYSSLAVNREYTFREAVH